MSVFGQIPPGLYVVRYWPDGKDGLASELPAMPYEKAMREAAERANQFQVEAMVTGIGPEAGFETTVKPVIDEKQPTER